MTCQHISSHDQNTVLCRESSIALEREIQLTGFTQNAGVIIEDPIGENIAGMAGNDIAGLEEDNIAENAMAGVVGDGMMGIEGAVVMGPEGSGSYSGGANQAIRAHIARISDAFEDVNNVEEDGISKDFEAFLDMNPFGNHGDQNPEAVFPDPASDDEGFVEEVMQGDAELAHPEEHAGLMLDSAHTNIGHHAVSEETLPADSLENISGEAVEAGEVGESLLTVLVTVIL